jgi:glycosyltransferase involved in cell wall biosynthesis
VAALGLDRAVEFAGERQDVAALLSSSDVFVLPSRSEASPNGVLEAMASGLPIVASRVGGIPELIDTGVEGVLVEPNDPAVLADAVIDLMDRPEWARVLGRAARERAEDGHGFDRMVARFERLYLTALGQQALAFDALRPARVSDRRVS